MSSLKLDLALNWARTILMVDRASLRNSIPSLKVSLAVPSRGISCYRDTPSNIRIKRPVEQ
ncbi:MAG: hypothetical protein ACI90U_001649 [Pseudomonadales bacterium]|jgi:hypothetical protein